MDSVSQFALGAAVAVAALGDRVRPLRAVLWGGVLGTLPDLDVLIDHGDAVANMVRHRAESHALLWLSLAAPVLAFGIAALHRERDRFRRWWWAVWLALVTHPLLDAMTVYGTKLWLPFDGRAVGVGSLFVIDPLYTLPLLVGTGWCLWRRGDRRGRRANALGLLLSTLYAGWSVGSQQVALSVAERSLRAQGIVATDLLATPAPLQTVLWRLLAATPQHLYEAHWSWCDGERPLAWTRIDRGAEHLTTLREAPAVLALQAQSQGFWKCWRDGDTVLLADARMGMEPRYVFTFEVGSAHSPVQPLEPTVLRRERLPLGDGLRWLWARMWGAAVPPLPLR
ncbi:MAG: metal-dependent hydrolase [Planctomycetes bacterium]|nr:metal-dependent hydrolase [Planctomycetota bacterium]